MLLSPVTCLKWNQKVSYEVECMCYYEALCTLTCSELFSDNESEMSGTLQVPYKV